jgi:hypothetical protein
MIHWSPALCSVKYLAIELSYGFFNTASNSLSACTVAEPPQPLPFVCGDCNKGVTEDTYLRHANMVDKHLKNKDAHDQ